MTKNVQDDQALLSRLQAQAVDFIIIGGFCGIMHGVSLVTRDLDVCCRFTPANLGAVNFRMIWTSTMPAQESVLQTDWASRTASEVRIGTMRCSRLECSAIRQFAIMKQNLRNKLRRST